MIHRAWPYGRESSQHSIPVEASTIASTPAGHPPWWRNLLEHSVTVCLLVHTRCRSYGDCIPSRDIAAMSDSAQRYRITVTPISNDGQQCDGRCTIEFEQRSQHNWMRQLETVQQQRALSCNEDAALVVATGLLGSLARAHQRTPTPLLSSLQPQLDELLLKLEQLQRGE